jgi:zinc/manganese transport system permease protein
MFAPGFFSSSVVQSALLIGGVVALVSGIVGVFTVMRSQSFTAESQSDVGAAGGSGSYLVNVNPLLGFVVAALVAAGAIEFMSGGKSRNRDITTGVILGVALGSAALFLFFDATHTSTTGATVTILFGSIFAISPTTIPVIVGLSVGTVLIVGLLYRRLFLTTLDPDLAQAHGVSSRVTGLGYMLGLSLAMSLSAITIGAVLGLALVVGPAAAAMHLSKRPGLVIALSGLIGVLCVWSGILLAYDSWSWPPIHHGWPVSFFVVALIFIVYLASHVGTHIVTQHRIHSKLSSIMPTPACHTKA